MSNNYKVIDNTQPSANSYLKMVCFRNTDIKKQILPFKWFLLTLVEMIVGTELLESLVTTGSVQPSKTLIKEDSEKYGSELHLSLHIPSGFITNILRKQIIEVLYYKYSLQYLILVPIGEPVIDEQKKIIDCSGTRFRARKNIFHQFMVLRRVYDLFWLVLNITVDLLVFVATTDIKLALLSALTLEAIRRLVRI